MNQREKERGNKRENRTQGDDDDNNSFIGF